MTAMLNSLTNWTRHKDSKLKAQAKTKRQQRDELAALIKRAAQDTKLSRADCVKIEELTESLGHDEQWLDKQVGGAKKDQWWSQKRAGKTDGHLERQMTIHNEAATKRQKLYDEIAELDRTVAGAAHEIRAWPEYERSQNVHRAQFPFLFDDDDPFREATKPREQAPALGR